jgi:hypothetical protein
MARDHLDDAHESVRDSPIVVIAPDDRFASSEIFRIGKCFTDTRRCAGVQDSTRELDEHPFTACWGCVRHYPDLSAVTTEAGFCHVMTEPINQIETTYLRHGFLLDANIGILLKQYRNSSVATIAEE